MIVVADTSVLLNLCCIGHEDLLRLLFSQALIPPAVGSEFEALARRDRRFLGLAIPSWIIIRAPLVVPHAIRDLAGLHPGEIQALALAMEIRAILLVDERQAHAAARSLQVPVLGLLAILLKAKSSGLVTAIAPLIGRLQRDANFWISPAVRARVLTIAGEG